MRLTNPNEQLPTRERLALSQAAIDEPLRTELENFFWLANPIEFAAKLYSLELPLDIVRELLLAKVSQPLAYKGPDLAMLCERAMQSLAKKGAVTA